MFEGLFTYSKVLARHQQGPEASNPMSEGYCIPPNLSHPTSCLPSHRSGFSTCPSHRSQADFGVGSEAARPVAFALTSVRRSNATCGFPRSAFMVGLARSGAEVSERQG